MPNMLLDNFSFQIAMLLIGLWFVIAIYLIVRGWINIDKVNYYILDSIPSVFTTLGVFGTFLGITIGLQDFDVDNIDASIPTLLGGMKTAFWTSIVGIGLSVISSYFLSAVKQKWDRVGNLSSEEVEKLSDLIAVVKESNEITRKSFEELRKAISSDQDDSLSTHLLKLRQQDRENYEIMIKTLGGQGETSLLTQIQKLREEQLTIGKETREAVVQINETVGSNAQLIERKFDEFTTLLEKGNTEALVKAIENVIGGFNDKLNELIERLVKENFEELNRSVQNLNQWQQENKVQVETLIAQFTAVSEQLTVSSTTLDSISKSTSQLVEDDSALAKLVTEMEQVLIKETNLRESVGSLVDSTTNLKESSDALFTWMERERNFADAVGDLIEKLKEIEELRNKASGFWTDLKKEMSEGVGIIKQGNVELMEDVNKLESSFNERMNQSFINLDKVLQSMVIEYRTRANELLNR